MSKVWLVLVALWRILVWWTTRNEEKKADREELKKAVTNAIKTKNTRNLHRLMSKL